MPLKYPDVEPWLAYKRELVKKDWDDVNLVTGREGKGKSKWARKVARALDPTWTPARIHYNYASYKDQYQTLGRGQCIILDESRLHARESMSRERMEILDDFKENRGLGIRHFLVFNRFTKVDRDLVTDRVSDWSYIRQRGVVEVRQPHTDLWFDAEGEPHESTRYPLVGKWRFTDHEPAWIVEQAAALKEARMRERYATSRAPAEAVRKPTVDDGLLEKALERIAVPKARVPDPVAAARIANAMASIGHEEIARSLA